MNQCKTLNSPQAIAEIHFQHDWNLTPAGTTNPLRYWSHVLFKDDPKRGQETWTLFVDIDKTPESQQHDYLVKIQFMAPTAPHQFLKPGQEFDLCIGSILKAHGVIKELCV